MDACSADAGRRLLTGALVALLLAACAAPDGEAPATGEAAEPVAVEPAPPPEVPAPGIDSIGPAGAAEAEGPPLDPRPWFGIGLLDSGFIFRVPEGIVTRTEGTNSSLRQRFASPGDSVVLSVDIEPRATPLTLQETYGQHTRELTRGADAELRYAQLREDGYLVSGKRDGRLYVEVVVLGDDMVRRLRLDYDPALEMRMLPVAREVVRSVRG